MKKNSFILFLLLVTVILNAQEKDLLVKSKISHVTVYLQGAEISRIATIQLQKGTQEYVIKELSQYIDDKSVRIKGDGDFTLMSVASNINYLNENTMTAEIEQLEEKRVALVNTINFQKRLLGVLKEEESMILTNKAIGGEQQGVKISELVQAADFFRSRLTDIKQKQFDIALKIRDLKIEMMKYSQQLMELNFKKELPSGEIRFKISSDKTQRITLTIKYVVGRAGWKPAYDIRVTDIAKPLNLIYKAKVFQQTDEDWENVQLTLSTGNPSVSSQKPTLKPWTLFFNNKKQTNYYKLQQTSSTGLYTGAVSGRVVDAEGLPLPGVSIYVKGTSQGTISGINGYYSLDVPDRNSTLLYQFIGMQSVQRRASNSVINVTLKADDVMLDEVVVTARGFGGRVSGVQVKSKKRKENKNKRDNSVVQASVYKRSTMAEFQITLPYSIASDGEEYTVDIQSHFLQADYEYSSVPKLDKDAFLMARLVNWEDYELLNGDANLYFEGTYKGVAYLNVENTLDTLDVSLGRDQDIVITRKLEKDFSERQTLGLKRKVSKSWKISIRNTKNAAVTILLEDQYPISSDKDIEIEMLEHSGATYEEKTGKVRWKITLAPKETRELYLKYSVKYPKKRQLIID